jgi:hypothetical protein
VFQKKLEELRCLTRRSLDALSAFFYTTHRFIDSEVAERFPGGVSTDEISNAKLGKDGGGVGASIQDRNQ